MYDVGDEPDPRFSLANERTFLAWTRTSLAMLAGSVALHSLQVPEPDLLRTALVVALALFAGVATALSYARCPMCAGPRWSARCAPGRRYRRSPWV